MPKPATSEKRCAASDMIARLHEAGGRRAAIRMSMEKQSRTYVLHRYSSFVARWGIRGALTRSQGVSMEDAPSGQVSSDQLDDHESEAERDSHHELLDGLRASCGSFTHSVGRDEKMSGISTRSTFCPG